MSSNTMGRVCNSRAARAFSAACATARLTSASLNARLAAKPQLPSKSTRTPKPSEKVELKC